MQHMYFLHCTKLMKILYIRHINHRTIIKIEHKKLYIYTLEGSFDENMHKIKFIFNII